MDNEERMRKAYQERIGKVYGIWEVINVEYDESAYNRQLWTIRCVKCGRTKQIKYGKELVKGRTGNYCECMAKKNQPKIKALTYGEKANNHIGEVYRNWKVIGWQDGKGLEVECINCGRHLFKPASQIFNCTAPHCVCENSAKYDESYIGKRYGRLVVQSITNKLLGGKNRLMFDCLCDCGNSRLARPINLENRDIVCCGSNCIYKNESYRLIDGNSNEQLYKKWQGMKDRCYNQSSSAYDYYGGRGIKVCDDWKNDYVAFRRWALENGYQDGLSIDRINPDGDYEPNNCRFITLSKNSRLARHTGKIRLNGKVRKQPKNAIKYEVELNGYSMLISEACKITGKCLGTVLYRIRTKGMTPQEAFDL